jgi:hypothetical protein
MRCRDPWHDDKLARSDGNGEERSEDESGVGAKGCIGKRDMKAKKGADLEVEEEQSSDDGRRCHTASITFDRTKVKAKLKV